MDIEIRLDKLNELYVKPIGRIDISSAVEFGTTVMDNIDDRDNIEKLTLDFSQVEYVSSMGLRILLELEKRMKDLEGMTLINVKDDIKKIFEMTGFDKILKVV